MAPPEEVNVLPVTDEHRPIAAVTLAFGNDPVARWFLPDAGSYLTYWPQILRTLGGAALDMGTADSIDDHSGVALWLPPGVVADDEALGPILDRGVPAGRRQEAQDFMAQMGKFHPPGPHWYLPYLGVDATRQGRGYGSALLRHALRRCDASAVPANLDASNQGNKRLYERHGFRELGVIQVGSSPPMWPMQRDPGDPGRAPEL
jgi:ribosomal protein S18 acetylase RimI-like enzyme